MESKSLRFAFHFLQISAPPEFEIERKKTRAAFKVALQVQNLQSHTLRCYMRKSGLIMGSKGKYNIHYLQLRRFP